MCCTSLPDLKTENNLQNRKCEYYKLNELLSSTCLLEILHSFYKSSNWSIAGFQS